MKKFISFILFIWFLLLVLPSQSSAFGLPWDTKKWINAIQDRDGDTKIYTEYTIDEDKIRLYTAGVERIQIDESGNITVDTNGLYYDKANKRWGFGTTSPEFDLHVEGGHLTELTLKTGTANTGDKAQINFIMTSAVGVSPNGAQITAERMGANAETDLYFSTTKSGDIVERVRIDSDGNIGFNTTTFGTNAQKVLGIGLGQAPESNPADMVQIVAKDYAAGDARLYIYGEANLNPVILGAGKIVLPQVNDAAAPTLAFGDGDTGFYEYNDDVLFVSVQGAYRFGFDSDKFYYPTEGGMAVLATIASATTPVYVFNGDNDTGIGRADADQLSLIAGGAEGVRVDTDSTAGNTRLLVYDVDSGALVRVSVGAPDSGGTGYKVLRVPN